MSRVIIGPCVQCGQCMTECRCGKPVPSSPVPEHIARRDFDPGQFLGEPAPSPDCPTQEDLDLATVQAIRDEMRKPAAQGEPRDERLLITDYDQAARVVHLYLDQWCDKSIPYPAMCADAARKVREAYDALRAERDEWRQEALRNIDWLHAEQDGTEKLRAELTAREEKYGVARIAIDRLQRDLVASRAELAEAKRKFQEAYERENAVIRERTKERDEARAEVERLRGAHQAQYDARMATMSALADVQAERDRLKTALERAKRMIGIKCPADQVGKWLEEIEALERGEGE